MSNLSNQQINSSFSGLLQVPGGITSTLQTVQDGNGNPTGLSLSTTQAGAITASLFKPSINGTPISGSINRLINDGFGDFLSVKDFGATGDGTTDDSAFFTTADAAGLEVFVPKGNYKISSSITLNNRFSFQQGAILIIPNGVTVNFVGGINANIYQIFNCSGTGAVVINPQKLTVGYPEWWGAITNDGNADCTAALTACVVACPITQLQLADYWINTTWYINTPNRVIRGVVNTVVGPLARVLTKSATADIIQVGPSSDPGSITAMTTNIRIEKICAWRAVAPKTNDSNLLASPSGFKFKYILGCLFQDLLSYESSIGFAYENQVSNYYYKLAAFRSSNGNPTSTNDVFYGHSLNSLDSNGAYHIQSIYWQDITGSIGGSPSLTSSIGITINGNYTDCSFLRPECNFFQYAFWHNQNGSTIPSIDNHLIGGIFDQSVVSGVRFSNIIAQSVISVIDTYSVVNNVGGYVANFWVDSSVGQISFVNCQAHGRGYNALGLFIGNSKNVLAKNNMWSELTRPIGLDNSNNCVIEDSIYNNSTTCTQPAIYLINNSSRNVFRPQCGSSASNVYPLGYGFINFTNGCQYNEVNCSGIDPAGIQGGSASKLIYNGTQITATGTFGTNNLASGIMN